MPFGENSFLGEHLHQSGEAHLPDVALKVYTDSLCELIQERFSYSSLIGCLRDLRIPHNEHGILDLLDGDLQLLGLVGE